MSSFRKFSELYNEADNITERVDVSEKNKINKELISFEANLNENDNGTSTSSNKSIWFLMVEKMDNGLQMIKYNKSNTLDLNSYVNKLKDKYNESLSSLNNDIVFFDVEEDNEHNVIKNIPTSLIEGRKLITIVIEDLIVELNKY